MKLPTNKTAITLDDFVFYVAFTRYGGHGFNGKSYLRKRIIEDLKGVRSIGGRFKEHNWTPISDPISSEGMSVLDYQGVTDRKGVVTLIDNAYLFRAENCMGTLTAEYGALGSVSLSDEPELPPYFISDGEEKLKRSYRDRYFDGIKMHEGWQEANAYISPMVKPDTIEHCVKATFGKPIGELNSDEFGLFRQKENKLYELCAELMSWLYDVAETLKDGHVDDVKMPERLHFNVDFRQLELFSGEAV